MSTKDTLTQPLSSDMPPSKVERKRNSMTSMRELNSKKYTAGNKDYWWYNICSPGKLTSGDLIVLNLWDSINRDLIKKVTLDLGINNWLDRIRRASTHVYKGLEICKIHIQRNHRTNVFIIYFTNFISSLRFIRFFRSSFINIYKKSNEQ